MKERIQKFNNIQFVDWKILCVQITGKIQESMARCTDRRDITKSMIKNDVQHPTINQ